MTSAAKIGEARRAIETVWRMESPRLIAGLVRMVRDVDRAEDLAQEALVAALEHWPESGIPDKPGAWLMTTARRRAIDQIRQHGLHQRKHEELARELEAAERERPDMADEVEAERIGDDLLRLMFIACHPVLSTEARVALTLRLLGGLSTGEIARAFLTPEKTVAQRIVRAKRSLSEKQAAFETPEGGERRQRLASVLEVIYLIFNEGYTATAGADWMRPALCQDALRLGRVLAETAPRDAEVLGLLALMELQASRLGARCTATGEPILLAYQDRSRWDRLLIRRGLAALEHARLSEEPPGAYRLQAEIAACHARAASAGQTDWPRIAALYALLAQLHPSPVVELNRAVALTVAFGPAAGLAHVDALRDEPALRQYHLLPSVRGDFLFRLERFAEARTEFATAATLTQNEREREFLLGRVRECENHAPGT